MGKELIEIDTANVLVLECDNDDKGHVLPMHVLFSCLSVGFFE